MRAQDSLPSSVTGLPRSVSDYFLDHFVVTTSGYFTTPPIQCALQVVGVDRLLYSVDYPYRSNISGAEFLKKVDLAPDDLQRVAAGNAERILKLGTESR
jgi:predicted TIM-barrel fold metal-dependent hydrolase